MRHLGRHSRLHTPCERLESRALLNADPVISEFMAVNDSTIADRDREFSDWIEIHNPSSTAIDLGGWHLTDDDGDLTKWTFPDHKLRGGGYLTVFASGKNQIDEIEYHTNFRLRGTGEYLALVRPDGLTTTSEFAPYPQQLADISYGFMVNVESSTVVAADDPLRVRVPQSGALGIDWTNRDFDDSAWDLGQGGVGYDLDGTLDAKIGFDVKTPMHEHSTSAYTRSSFNLPNAQNANQLALDVEYNDGFVAYLNGQEVASRNARSVAQSPLEGLVSYWAFEGNALDTAADFANYSGVSQDDLVALEGNLRFTEGQVGSAIAFGQQAEDPEFLTAPISEDHRFDGVYSFEAWIFPTDLDAIRNRLVVRWGNLDQHAFEFTVRDRTDAQNELNLIHLESNGETEIVARGGTIVANAWQHVAAVADGEWLRVYLNGEPVGEAPYDGTLFDPTTENLGIGDDANGSRNRGFDGLIDELAIWNVALSDNQIRSHYQSGSYGIGLLPLQDMDFVPWNATAKSPINTTRERIDISRYVDHFEPGNNVLALHSLNISDDDRTSLIRASLDVGTATVLPDSQRYFTQSTPGSANNAGISDLGPIISDVEHVTLSPQGITSTTLVGPDTAIAYFVPVDNSLGNDWMQAEYAPGLHGEAWMPASENVGFNTSIADDPTITTDIADKMLGQNSSIYLRTEFDIANPTDVDQLRLQMQYDDGFIAYLNGNRIAASNVPQTENISPSAGLVTYYSFDDTLADMAKFFTNGTGQQDDTLFAQSTSGAVATSFSEGRVGRAVRISRDASETAILTATDSDDLDLAENWTVEAFVKPDRDNLGEWDRFATKWFPDDTSWHFAFRGANNGLDLFLNGTQAIHHTDTATVPLDEWSHVAITGDASTGVIKAWLNGVEVGSAPYVAVTPGNSPLMLGNFQIASGGLQFSGLVDEFAIWDVALSAEQLAAHAGENGYGLTPIENAGQLAVWNLSAEEARNDELKNKFATFDVSDRRHLLKSGTNILAIQGLNLTADDTDFFIAPRLEADSGSAAQGPILVTAHVGAAIEQVRDVQLTYRTMFSDEITIVMVDNGLGPDAVAADDNFSAWIPANALQPGEMIRYFVSAEDAADNSSRAPNFSEPENSAEYFGTVIDGPDINTALPVLHRFIENPGGAETDRGVRASIFYDGEFYDNVFIRVRGGTARSWPKKSYKIEFNDDHQFRFNDDERRVDEFNLNTTYTDKSYVRSVMSYEIHNAADSAAPITFPLHVRQNDRFFSVAHFVEQPDRDFLRRNDLDPDGALYKGTASPTNGFVGNPNAAFAKKTRKYEDFSDLQEFINGLALSGQDLENYLYDNVDLARQINFMAVNVILQNIDATDKNFYVYRDTEGSGEWRMIPWDLDLVLGPDALNTDKIVFDDESAPAHTSHPYLGTLALPFHGRKNHLFDGIINTPSTNQMFLRRLRTLMDQILAPLDTPVEERFIESRIDSLAEQLRADVLLDKERWAGNAHFGSVDFTLDEAIARIRNEYLDPRRSHLFDTHSIEQLKNETTVIIPEFSEDAAFFVPTDNSLGNSWKNVPAPDNFDQWQTGAFGVGFENRAADYQDLIKTRLKPKEACSSCTSIYIRKPFRLDSPDSVEELTLQVKYDDGFVAYINGVEVARSNVVDDIPSFDARARGNPDSMAVHFSNFNIREVISSLNLSEENVLAIQAVNSSPSSNDMLMSPMLVEGYVAEVKPVGIPNRQTAPLMVSFGDVETFPINGNQDEEFVEVKNGSPDAVDISGWEIRGGIEYVMPGGTVIAGGASLFLTPDAAAFRNRSVAPTGGMGLFVQGGYRGQLSSRGETLELLDASGSLVTSITTAGDLSDPQQFLRVTELHYNPAPNQPASEFIEFRNISQTVTLDLAGVRITDGPSEVFDFTDSGVTSLAPGQFVLVVGNANDFAAAYPNVNPTTLAGVFAGNLSNRGETIRIEDADNRTILEFRYQDGRDDDESNWHPTTDGDGYSLVIVDAKANIDAWNRGTSWRPSQQLGGSPAASDTEFVNPDYSDDGTIDDQDLDLLSAAIRTGQTDPRFDLTGDGKVDQRDRNQMIDSVLNTSTGDSNLDGVFNSEDLAFVMAQGQYNDNTASNSGWAAGDWNGDGKFDSEDIVAAFVAGHYQVAPAIRPELNLVDAVFALEDPDLRQR